MIIAKLLGGKNDGAVVHVPFDDPSDSLPWEIVTQHKQWQLKYVFERADFEKNEAVYEYSGIVKNESEGIK